MNVASNASTNAENDSLFVIYSSTIFFHPLNLLQMFHLLKKPLKKKKQIDKLKKLHVT